MDQNINPLLFIIITFHAEYKPHQMISEAYPCKWEHQQMWATLLGIGRIAHVVLEGGGRGRGRENGSDATIINPSVDLFKPD